MTYLNPPYDMFFCYVSPQSNNAYPNTASPWFDYGINFSWRCSYV